MAKHLLNTGNGGALLSQSTLMQSDLKLDRWQGPHGQKTVLTPASVVNQNAGKILNPDTGSFSVLKR